jgi:TonB family protein
LDVCIAANGRVTSGSIASSSGYPRLDDAALKWLKDQRFAPVSKSKAYRKPPCVPLPLVTKYAVLPETTAALVFAF